MVDRLWSKSLPALTGCGGLRHPRWSMLRHGDTSRFSGGPTPGFANCPHPAVCKTVADPGQTLRIQGTQNLQYLRLCKNAAGLFS